MLSATYHIVGTKSDALSPLLSAVTNVVAGSVLVPKVGGVADVPKLAEENVMAVCVFTVKYVASPLPVAKYAYCVLTVLPDADTS